MLLVVLNGVALPAAPPPRVIAGHVASPVVPIVTRIAQRVEIDPFGAIVLAGRGRRCVLHIGVRFATCGERVRSLVLAPFALGGAVYVPLADVVRALGGEVSFDAASETVSVRLVAEHVVLPPAFPTTRLPLRAPATSSTPPPVVPPPVVPPPAAPIPAPGPSEYPQPRRTALPVCSFTNRRPRAS